MKPSSYTGRSASEYWNNVIWTWIQSNVVFQFWQIHLKLSSTFCLIIRSKVEAVWLGLFGLLEIYSVVTSSSTTTASIPPNSLLRLVIVSLVSRLEYLNPSPTSFTSFSAATVFRLSCFRTPRMTSLPLNLTDSFLWIRYRRPQA